MADITNQSLNEIIQNVKTKKISSTELTKAYVKNIESAKKLNAFVTQHLIKLWIKLNNSTINQILINCCQEYL